LEPLDPLEPPAGKARTDGEARTEGKGEGEGRGAGKAGAAEEEEQGQAGGGEEEEGGVEEGEQELTQGKPGEGGGGAGLPLHGQRAGQGEWWASWRWSLAIWMVRVREREAWVIS
jgi:hypothetical protein